MTQTKSSAVFFSAGLIAQRSHSQLMANLGEASVALSIGSYSVSGFGSKILEYFYLLMLQDPPYLKMPSFFDLDLTLLYCNETEILEYPAKEIK